MIHFKCLTGKGQFNRAGFWFWWIGPVVLHPTLNGLYPAPLRSILVFKWSPEWRNEHWPSWTGGFVVQRSRRSLSFSCSMRRMDRVSILPAKRRSIWMLDVFVHWLTNAIDEVNGCFVRFPWWRTPKSRWSVSCLQRWKKTSNNSWISVCLWPLKCRKWRSEDE